MEFSEELLLRLTEAYHEARRGKRKTKDEHEFEVNEIENLINLRDAILKRTYRPGAGKAFVLKNPVRREVFTAPFRDRIVHRFIFDVIYPFWDRRFIYDSFSTRTGKGTSFGIRRVEEQIRKVTRNYQKEAFVIKLDLQGFFMSLPREKVFERAVFGLKRQFPRGGKLYSTTKFLLEQVIFDEPTNGVRLFGKREEFQKIPRDKSLFYSGEGRGLVIGNLTSQILANIYLDQLDRFVKFKLGYKFYGRYADDFYILVPEEELVKAKRDIGEIERFLREELRLKLHPKKRYIQNIKKGIPFLGVVIYPGRKVPGRRVRANFRKRAREVASGVRNPEIITSYLGYMKNLNGKKVTKKVFEENGWSFKF